MKFYIVTNNDNEEIKLFKEKEKAEIYSEKLDEIFLQEAKEEYDIEDMNEDDIPKNLYLAACIDSSSSKIDQINIDENLFDEDSDDYNEDMIITTKGGEEYRIEELQDAYKDYINRDDDDDDEY